MSKHDRDFEDDGRTVADMDVEGMRSSVSPFEHFFSPVRPSYASQRKSSKDFTPSEDTPEPTKRELRAYALNALLAGLAIAGVFAVVFLIFILLCVFVWFK